MPRLPRARARSTAQSGLIPCVHNVRNTVTTTAYAIGEMETVSVHFVDGRSWQPCTKFQGKCAFCDAGNRPRAQGYFPALLITQGGEGRTLTPVVVGVPEKSREKFPPTLTGKVLELKRTGDLKLRAEVLRSVILPAGVTSLFDVHDVLEHHWFRNLDAETPTPAIAAETMAQVIKSIFDLEARDRQERERGKAQAAEKDRRQRDITEWSVGELEIYENLLDKMPTTAERAIAELRRRGLRPPPPPIEAPRRVELPSLKLLVPEGAAVEVGYPAPPPETLTQFTDRQVAESRDLLERLEDLPGLVNYDAMTGTFRERLKAGQSDAARRAAQTRADRKRGVA